MSAQGAALDVGQGTDLLTGLFGNKNVPDDRKIWIDGLNQEKAITKAEAIELTERLHDGYTQSGILRSLAGQRAVVILFSENQLIQFPNVLALVAAGVVVATCPSQATEQELQKRVDVLQAVAVLCSRTSIATAQKVRAPRGSQHLHLILQDSGSMDVINEKGQSYISFQRRQWTQSVDQDAASFLIFSSGTTGAPKAVQLSCRNVLAMVRSISQYLSSILSLPETPCMPGTLDSAHAAGLTLNTFVPVYTGIETHLLPSTDVELLMRRIEEYRMNTFFTVPPILNRMIEHPHFPAANLKSLRYISAGAARTPTATQQAMGKKLRDGVFCQQAWGMTECTFVVLIHPLGVLGPWDSVGKCLPGCSVKVVDGKGKQVGFGERGELLVSGPVVSNGYFRNETKTLESFESGWLRTGDVAKIDEQGYVYIIGREKDVIKYNATQVSPEEIESILLAHDSVIDAAVVGRVLDDGNELPTAFVVLAENVSTQGLPQKLREVVDGQVSNYKKLRGGVHIVASLPKNAMGKLQRQEVRGWLEKQRNGQAKL